jgi:RNA exonuclease 1
MASIFRAGVCITADQFGVGPGFGEFKTDYESIFERMSRGVGRGGPGSIRSAVVDHGNPSVMHGAKANTSVPCTSDAEVLEGLLTVIPGHEFSFGRFTALANALGCKYCCVPLRAPC